MVLKGSGSLQILEKETNKVRDVPVKEGQVVSVPEGVYHGFKNEGSSIMRVLIQWGPPTNEKIVRYRTGTESTATKVEVSESGNYE